MVLNVFVVEPSSDVVEELLQDVAQLGEVPLCVVVTPDVGRGWPVRWPLSRNMSSMYFNVFGPAP